MRTDVSALRVPQPPNRMRLPTSRDVAWRPSTRVSQWTTGARAMSASFLHGSQERRSHAPFWFFRPPRRPLAKRRDRMTFIARPKQRAGTLLALAAGLTAAVALTVAVAARGDATPGGPLQARSLRSRPPPINSSRSPFPTRRRSRASRGGSRDRTTRMSSARSPKLTWARASFSYSRSWAAARPCWPSA
jgi:hypothetical protein